MAMIAIARPRSISMLVSLYARVLVMIEAVLEEGSVDTLPTMVAN